MTISYHGHATFKLRSRFGTVVTDPYQTEVVGFPLPSLSADVVTVSHNHPDHNAVAQIGGTARRKKPFIISEAGEYEVADISVFGVPLWHDAIQGGERGRSIAYTIMIEDVRVCHLGDLGHELTPAQITQIGAVDVLLCPVGGVYTINPEQAVKVIRSLEPSIVIPMHFRTPKHEPQTFAEVFPLEAFLKEYGTEPAAVAKLEVEAGRLPEETELVVLAAT